MKSEILKVVVIASALPVGYSGVEGDELELPNKEAHSLEKRGYVRIIWDGVQVGDMTTKKERNTVTGLPEAKKAERQPKELADEEYGLLKKLSSGLHP